MSPPQVTWLERGSGPGCLIMLHGIGGGAVLFEPQLAGLCDTTRVVAWNMPGYGDSPPRDPLTFEALSAALGGLIEALEAGPVDLFGHSIGGMVIQDYLARGGAGVRSAILCCTTAAFGSRDGSFQETFLRARLGPLDSGQSMAELARDSVPKVLGADPDPQAAERAVAAMGAVPPETYRAAVRCLTDFDRRADLTRIAAPVMLLAGERDGNAPLRTMTRMAEKIPGAGLEVVAGAGHLLPLERPETTNRLVRAFLSSLPSGS